MSFDRQIHFPLQTRITRQPISESGSYGLRQSPGRRIAILLILFCLPAAGIAQTAARVEMTLTSRDLVPYTGSWGYWVSNVEECGQVGQKLGSLGEAVTCYENLIAQSENNCPQHIDPVGSDWTSQSLTYGRDWNQSWDYRGKRNSWHSQPDQHSSVPHCFESSSFNLAPTLRRQRDVNCSSANVGPGYTDGSAVNDVACKNNTQRKVTVSPIACPAKSDGDPRVGNPCDAATGDKVEVAVDYVSPVVKFSRTYHSLAQIGTAGFGIGWTHTYSTSLAVVGGVPKVIAESSGYSTPLSLVAMGVYQSDTGSMDQVRAGTGGQWVVYRQSGAKEIFSATGQLLQLVSVEGLVTQLAYGTDQRLETVTGPFGHKLTFGYDEARQLIATVQDPGGYQISYEYTNDNLTKVIYQDLKYVQYLYERTTDFPHALTGIIDETTLTTPRFATFDYDSQGRVILSKHAGDIGQVTLDYSVPDQTTVTYADSTQETFDFTPHPNPGKWRVIGDSSNGQYDSMREAISVARGLCTDCWNLELASFSSYTAPAGGGANFRKLLGSSLTGQAYQYTASSDRRTDHVTDARGNETKYANSTYHRDSFTEANQDTTGHYKRTTETTGFLNDTSSLPLSMQMPSTSESHIKSLATTYDSPASQRVTSQGISGFDGSGGYLPARTTYFQNFDPIARLPKKIIGPRTFETNRTFWDESSPGVACTSVGGGACGQLKSSTNAAGHVTTYDLYDPDGRLRQMTDPNGLVTSFTYDTRGRLKSVSEGASRATTYEYYPTGLLQTATTVNGASGSRVLTYVWTDAHLLDYIVDSSGRKLDLGYDSRGNETSRVTRWSNGAAQTTEATTYDSRNRIDTRKLGNRDPTDFTVDAAGNMVCSEGRYASPGSTCEGLTSKWLHQYDPLNRLEQTTDPQGGVTKYGYDLQDNLTSVQPPNGGPGTGTKYTYDDLGNLRKEVSPDRGVTLYGYDVAGNMTCKADGRYSGNAATCEVAGNRWTYAYDEIDRVTSIDYSDTGPGADVSFNWDVRPDAQQPGQAGRLRQITLQNGAVTVTRKMDYDAWGNVTWIQQAVTGGPTRETSFKYDNLNQLTEITYPSGRIVKYKRFATGQIKEVTATKPGFNGGQPLVVVALAQYKPFGPPQSIGYGNGTVQVRETDAAGSPTSFWLADATTYEGIDGRTYTVNSAGNITALTDDFQSVNSRNYAYDGLDRVTWDSGASTTNPTYNYDGNGNRLTRAAGTFPAQSFTYGPGSNRDVGQSYDGMGNSFANLATYDSGGRLESVTDPSTSDELQLAYNGLGELARTLQYHPDACTNQMNLLSTDYYNFAPDGRALSIKTVRNVSYETDYIWLDNLPVAQFMDHYDSDGVYIGTDWMFLHPDHLGTPRLGTSQQKIVSWRYRSDAFGIPGAETSMQVRLRLPGQIALGVAGVNYNYFRDYDPALGRYLECDPIGVDGGLNTYGYATQNPILNSDPTGLFVGPLPVATPAIASPAGAIVCVFACPAVAYGMYQQYAIPIQDWLDSALRDPPQDAANVIEFPRRSRAEGDSRNCPPDNGCQRDQEGLLRQRLLLSGMLAARTLGIQDYALKAKAFNERVASHNLRCPQNKVAPLQIGPRGL